MKLIDTSAWIEYYRERGNPECKHLVTEAIAADLAAINGIVQTELLVFARSPNEFTAVQSDLSALHWLDLSTEVFNTASKTGFALRRQGITVPATDLLMVACALVYNAEVIHCDGHFEIIREHTPLRTAPCAR